MSKSPLINDYDSGIAFMRALEPLVRNRDKIDAEFVKLGYTAHKDYQNWFCQFCSSEECEINKRYETELAIKRLFDPVRDLPHTPGVIKPGYKSDFLDDLTAQNERTSTSDETPWVKMQIDRCRKQAARYEVNNRNSYDKKWNDLKSRSLDQLSLEAKSIADDYSDFGVNRNDRRLLINKFLIKYMNDIGFKSDTTRFKNTWPCVKNVFCQDWCLILITPNTDYLEPRSGRSLLMLDLYLCRSHYGANFGRMAKPGEYLNIRYSVFIDSFLGGYQSFRSNRELEFLIKAHCDLIKLIWDPLMVALGDLLRE